MFQKKVSDPKTCLPVRAPPHEGSSTGVFQKTLFPRRGAPTKKIEKSKVKPPHKKRVLKEDSFFILTTCYD
jgi:hypothetical protein